MTTQVEDVFEEIPSLGKRVQKMIGKEQRCIAFLREDDDCIDALDRNIPPYDWLEKPDAKAALKRRYGGKLPSKDKRLRYSGQEQVFKSCEEREKQKFLDQYRLGIDTFDPMIEGMGCGTYILGIDVVSCISPVQQNMHLEIMSGSWRKGGQDSIRFSKITDDIA
ncbi:hypothetical protein D6C87_08622 [Aureobasidium pullulans]|uniref:Uncharacterized protein n=1 Tax=Aureobasidium pullulans TaxID=5580 RepID=A0AB38LS09_AURPU|nr:hypothetical protein D6C94_06926 [Aureobasidium pullulans]THZ37254.1 hypothetical protein D6C87_08622 [Aureobasidium pullulans]